MVDRDIQIGEIVVDADIQDSITHVSGTQIDELVVDRDIQIGEITFDLPPLPSIQATQPDIQDNDSSFEPSPFIEDALDTVVTRVSGSLSSIREFATDQGYATLNGLNEGTGANSATGNSVSLNGGSRASSAGSITLDSEIGTTTHSGTVSFSNADAGVAEVSDQPGILDRIRRPPSYYFDMDDRNEMVKNLEEILRNNPVTSPYIQETKRVFDEHNDCGLPIVHIGNLHPSQWLIWQHTSWMTIDEEYAQWFNGLRQNLKDLVRGFDGERVLMPETRLRKFYGDEHIVSSFCFLR